MGKRQRENMLDKESFRVSKNRQHNLILVTVFKMMLKN